MIPSTVLSSIVFWMLGHVLSHLGSKAALSVNDRARSGLNSWLKETVSNGPDVSTDSVPAQERPRRP